MTLARSFTITNKNNNPVYVIKTQAQLPDKLEPGDTSPVYSALGRYVVVYGLPKRSAADDSASDDVPANAALPHLPNLNLVYFIIQHTPVKSEYLTGTKSGVFALEYSLS